MDIKVRASLEGLKRWLLFHYDSAEILDPGDEFEEKFSEAVNALYEKYRKNRRKKCLFVYTRIG